MAERAQLPGSALAHTARRPIFIQAMWRTGSTYVWKKFREQPKYRAYYEPLHECLVRTREQVQSGAGPEKQAALRHPSIEEFYFAEFPFTAGGGVEGFEKPLSYERYCLQEDENDEALYRYISNLIGHAERSNQTAALQFNRGLLRAGWLARNFSPIQILVLRNPLDVWKSFARFEGQPFETYVSTVLGQNQGKPPLDTLPSWLEFPREVRGTFEEEFAVYAPFAAANRCLLYPAFFDFYLLGILHCAQYADCILDLDGIRDDPEVRRQTTERLGALGVEMSLDDCALPPYPMEAADQEWIAYEHFSQGFLRAKLPPAVSLPAEKFEAHKPLLGEYFRKLLSGFIGPGEPVAAGVAPVHGSTSGTKSEKHALAVRLFESRQYQAASNLLGAALAERETGELWNDWATAQNACARPHLAELGFGQALKAETPDRDAAGNLGALLFGSGRYREALPLLEKAELDAGERTRPILSDLVNRTRESLRFCATPVRRTAGVDVFKQRPGFGQGFTVFLTGLSGAGKSTIAKLLWKELTARSGRTVVLLDGDVVRKQLSPELGFSREHRDLNIRRIGFVAAQVTRCGGIAICAPIAPYDAVRKEVRGMVEPDGGFCLVHVATPLAVCEQRDVKGLYAKARAGIVQQFTGISDPYEEPTDAELRIDTTRVSRERAVETILSHLSRHGYLMQPASPAPELAHAGAY